MMLPISRGRTGFMVLVIVFSLHHVTEGGSYPMNSGSVPTYYDMLRNSMDTLSEDIHILRDMMTKDTTIIAKRNVVVPVCSHKAKVGCYDRRKNPIKKMKFLMDIKETGVKKMDMAKFICLCAAVTRDLQISHFAMSEDKCYYGELDTKANQLPKKCMDSADPKKFCTGNADCVGFKDHTYYIYSNKAVHPCDKNKGGCAQVCTKNGGLAVCSCHSGFTLGKDGKSCVEASKCGFHFTTARTDGYGNMVSLIHQPVDCSSKGAVVSSFHLQRPNPLNVRYYYKCCSVAGRHGTCNGQEKTTAFDSDGGGRTWYLDRQVLDCGVKGYVSSFKVESSNRRIRYRYKCCSVPNAPQCYSLSTSPTYDGNGSVRYLDRQVVTCKEGYALSYFRLARANSYQVYYAYRCCQVN